MKKTIGQIKTLAWFTFRESIKNRVVWIAFAFALISIGLASFLSEVAITEAEQIQVSFLAASYRLCGVFVIVIFVVSTIVREFNDKCLELYLSLPIARLVYFLGKIAGFILCSTVVALLFSSVLLLYVDHQGIFYWSFSFLCELIIMTLVSVFCVFTFNQQIPTSVSVAIFFYMLCRSTDAIILISKSAVLHSSLANILFSSVIDVLFSVFPRFDRFTKTEWLVYGDIANVVDFLFPTLIFVTLLGAASMFDFMRKNI